MLTLHLLKYFTGFREGEKKDNDWLYCLFLQTDKHEINQIQGSYFCVPKQQIFKGHMAQATDRRAVQDNYALATQTHNEHNPSFSVCNCRQLKGNSKSN